MTSGDKALERIIAELTTAVAMNPDPRLARLQRDAIAMRSAEMVAWMERAQGLRRSQATVIRPGKWRGR